MGTATGLLKVVLVKFVLLLVTFVTTVVLTGSLGAPPVAGMISTLVLLAATVVIGVVLTVLRLLILMGKDLTADRGMALRPLI